ncbi:MAG: thiamine diphosphokinase, partial [candidate division Zixibacteria bacterium]|nr:thiamine diphosphokinase [candidate division Zixibacteria bacterium]
IHPIAYIPPMSRTCACIVCDGEPASSEVLREFVERCSLIIAADGGIEQLKQIGVVPDLLIGDMDSAAEALTGGAAGAEIIRYPQDKNESDSELAVVEALKRGADRVLLLSAAGKRSDHFFSNLAILTRHAGRVFLVDGNFAVFSLDAETSGSRLKIEQHKRLSVFSFGESVQGLAVSGTKWELNDVTIQAGSLGLSNEATGAAVTISIQSGTLLVFAECRPDDIEVEPRPVE